MSCLAVGLAGCVNAMGLERKDLPPYDAYTAELEDGDIETDEPSGDAPDLPDGEPECTLDNECDDDEMCNGEETCVDRECRSGTPLDNGSTCTMAADVDGTCEEGVCIPITCGDETIDEGEECDDGNDVNGDGCDNDCTYSCHGADECDDGHDCTEDSCNAETNACDNLQIAEGTTCRPAAGDCDAAETCSDGNPDCPPDAFLSLHVECRSSAGQCDRAEFCTGISSECPSDTFAPDTTYCDDGGVLYAARSVRWIR